MSTRPRCVEPVRLQTALLLAALLPVAACSRTDAVEFSMNPEKVSACEMPVAVEIRWDATALGLKRAYVEVNNIAAKPRTWVAGESRGSEKTGVWAHDGFTATLKSMNGVVLARRTLTTERCPGKDWL